MPNHLLDEKSPYLLAHAHNPVDWYPWGPVAFEKAKKEGKPVLLSIGYSTCHWCHVMAHESFEDSAIAKIINENFISIKVDREERPDIDHIYMTAATAMGSHGGWPLTVFLTPQADPFYAGTYFPPLPKWGSPGFADLLNSLASAWKSDKENILASAASITEQLRGRDNSKNGDVSLFSYLNRETSPFLDRAYDQLKAQFDPAHGGFGSQPKFPMGHNVSFLLRYYKRSKGHQALEMAVKTLTAMAHGGIWDHLGGGFHRYSTDDSWHVPHFEKMLYDQALLSRAYLEGYQAAGNKEFAQVARDIFDYVLGEMRAQEGGFYSAQDADSPESEGAHLKEGAFYVFTQTEIEQTLGPEHAAVFNYCYGTAPGGNARFDPHGEFRDRNILYREHSDEEASNEFNRQIKEIQGILKEGQSRLLSYRSKRRPPQTDDKVLCDWNGLMIASLSFGSRVLHEEKYAKAACKAADFILSSMRQGRRLLHRWRHGQAGITATIEDYAFFIYGLLELYEAVFERKYLDEARKLADEMISLFGDPAGGFYMTAIDAENLILRPKEIYDGAIPSGNSVAAQGLLRLYTLTHQESYQDQAQALFGCFAPTVAAAPFAYCFLLSALDWHLHGALEIKLEGRRDDPEIANMLKVLYKYFMPSKAVAFSSSAQGPKAVLCYKGTCRPPIHRAENLEEELIKEGL